MPQSTQSSVLWHRTAPCQPSSGVTCGNAWSFCIPLSFCRIGKECLLLRVLERVWRDHICEALTHCLQGKKSSPPYMYTCRFVCPYVEMRAREGPLHREPGTLCSTAGSTPYKELAMSTNKPFSSTDCGFLICNITWLDELIKVFFMT